MLRGAVGLAFLFCWLRLFEPASPLLPRARWISLGVGGLFGANVFLMFKAIEAVAVPIAVLTYFVYPLLTGLAAAAFGLDRLTWRGAAAAVAAFVGLSVMIGAHPGGLMLAGVVAAFASACCRVAMLLVIRAKLQNADPLLITWYSMMSSTILFGVVSLATLNWQPPLTVAGWITVLALGAAVTTGILGVFGSTVRIGPFRTALFMNLEPLLATIGSAVFLDEIITPVQAFGGAMMIAALVAFQVRR